MSKRATLNYPDTITFRVPRDVADRLRQESVRDRSALADVAREYLVAGIEAVDSSKSVKVLAE